MSLCSQGVNRPYDCHGIIALESSCLVYTPTDLYIYSIFIIVHTSTAGFGEGSLTFTTRSAADINRVIECRRNSIVKASHKALKVSQSLQALVPDHASAIRRGLPYSRKSHPPAVPLTHMPVHQFPPSSPKTQRMSTPNLSYHDLQGFTYPNSFISGNYDIPPQPRDPIHLQLPNPEAPSKGLKSTHPPKLLPMVPETGKVLSPCSHINVPDSHSSNDNITPSSTPINQSNTNVVPHGRQLKHINGKHLPPLTPSPSPSPLPPPPTTTTATTETTEKVNSCRVGQQGSEGFPQTTDSVKEGSKDEADRKRAAYVNKSTGNLESCDFEPIHTWLGNHKPPGTIEIDSPLYLVLQGNVSQEPMPGGAGEVEKTDQSGGKVGSNDGDCTSESAPRRNSLEKVRRSNSDYDLSSRSTVMRKGAIRVHKDPLDTISTQRQLSAEDLSSMHNSSNSPLNHDQYPSSKNSGTVKPYATFKYAVAEEGTIPYSVFHSNTDQVNCPSSQPTLNDEGGYDYVRCKCYSFSGVHS